VRDDAEFRAPLTGPIASVFTPFRESGEIDIEGLRRLIDSSIAGGSKSIILTYGDSHYVILDDQEVIDLTRAVVEHTAGRAMVVAADRAWATRKTVEFARHVREIGADMLMVLPPDWADSCTAETLAEHYATVAREIPMMIVTSIFAQRGTAFGLKTLEMVMQRTSGPIAVKDDVCGEFARKMSLLVHERWPVISGGQKQNHLNAMSYGCGGYFSLYVIFKPEIAQRYWSAVEAGDISAACRIIAEYDMPYFDHIMSLPGGFDAGIHGTLELFGIARRWRRKPYYSLNDAEMKNLASFFESRGLL